ncbi:MAG: tandem-95 repeat protein [Fibrobacter sp.]|uniref:Ig-like domain-containing protein n=1 Tax=Fibrobacter sp. TaxID=35828 RepID=UPI0025C69D50|nr:Ig-like domain-containing protein [Fibrobacter sp.]MBQ7078476.1 tandem-95 repeat protein [Fibrobacter sp.]
MKSLSLSLVMALTGVTMGFAGATVWSFDKKTGNDMQPAYWYDYAQPAADGATGVRADTDEGYKQFTANLALKSSEYSVAGFGFVWKQVNSKDAVVDISAHSGLCLTYKADRPFRVDLKQATITDYNYFGVVVPAQSEFSSKFLDFQNFAQEEGWGQQTTLDLTQQLAIQMSYKEGFAENIAKNVITVAAISLGECETVVEEPTLMVLEPYDKAQTVTMKETDSLKIPLSKIFAAKEGADVTIATSMPGNILTMVKPMGAPTLNDELVFVSRNLTKDTSLTLNVFALSSDGASAKALFNISITDEGDGPVGPTCPGDPECPDDPPAENHPTVVLEPYNKVVVDTMKEADTLKIPLEKLFADEDNDKLVFVVEMSAPLMKVLNSLDKVTLKDTLFIVPSGIKKDTTINVAVYATDGKSDPVFVQFTMTIEDSNSPPVAADTSYTTTEGETLIVPIVRGLAVIGYDLDGDDFLVVPIDSTKHGKLTEFSQLGSFVYTPDKDFRGDDTLTYVLVETANHDMISNKATVVIHVDPVNAKPTVTVADSAFLKDTLALDMDFDEDTVAQIKIPTKSLIFSDREVTEGTQKFTYKAVGTKIVAIVDSVNASNYFISVKPVANATGLATIFFYASDGKDSVGVTLSVKLISPKDVAQAVKDEYSTFNDSTLTVDAKKGVLANDVYPEGVTKGMEAQLAQMPAYGTLTLNKDGSFTYKPEAGFEGVDYFGYFAVINGMKSKKAAMVTIEVDKRNLLPTVVVDTKTLDTTVTEDFPTSRALKYTKSVVASWFKDPEGDSLTYSAKSKDGKLKVEITDKGVLEINSAPDSSGKAYVVVTATDKKSGSKSFEFCVNITPVNDKPVLLHGDTVYVRSSGWNVKWNLEKFVKDVDGDQLTFTPNETSALTKYMTISLKGSELTVTSIKDLSYKEGNKYAIGVKVSDPSGMNVTIPLYIIVDEKRAGLKPQIAQPKNTWQNAVMAKRGTVKIMDMNGRVIWNAKLPVNPAEVKSVSAQVQGRKILRVNNQTWTIK